MAGIHQTLKEARSLYAEALKLQEAVLASHRDLKGCVVKVQTWHESAESLMAQVEISRVRLKYLGRGFLALIFMIGTLAGRAGFSRCWRSGSQAVATDSTIKLLERSLVKELPAIVPPRRCFACLGYGDFEDSMRLNNSAASSCALVTCPAVILGLSSSLRSTASTALSFPWAAARFAQA